MFSLNVHKTLCSSLFAPRWRCLRRVNFQENRANLKENAPKFSFKTGKNSTVELIVNKLCENCKQSTIMKYETSSSQLVLSCSVVFS